MEQPLISTIQKVRVYETKARYYIIGSNSTETAFRVLKVDRTEPKDLHVHDDKHVYNKLDIRKLLEMIASGNTFVNTKQKQQTDGLMKCASAFGIVGFVRFLEGYYMILITKRSVAAVIGGHTIYKIEDTVMQYIPNDSVRYTHPEESKYVKMFQSVDLSSNFYFSYSYDLTHTLQYNMSPSLDPDSPYFTDCQDTTLDKTTWDRVYGVKVLPEERFVWNKYLTEPFEHHAHSDWVLHVVYGFIAQTNIYIFGKSVYVTLIARRSTQFAGPRFLKRGANSQGAVANEVETEQIVQDMCVTELCKARISSFVQMRGSIPIYWSQDISTMVPKPPITVDQKDPYFHTAGLHFNRCLYRYGAPIILFNLVKRREKRDHESLLRDEYIECKNYLNQFLPPDKQMIYVGFDMARYTKNANNDVFERLARISRFFLKRTGFFLHLPCIKNDLWEQDELKSLMGVRTATGCKQTGVVRTNCVDCIDRTNTAQFAVGKCALAYQLYALGVLAVPNLDFDTDCVTMLEELYEDQGNTVALQYGGSYLVHRIEGYRKIAPWKAHSVDIFQTLSRYYSNAFSDTEKQQAMNVFLGVFIPRENEPNIWDLPTDYYLHNKDAVGEKILRKSYTMWCDPKVFQYLPLPYAEACKQNNCIVQGMSKDEEAVNMFSENYKPFTLTDFTKLSQDMDLAIRNYKPKLVHKNPSPFVRRISTDNKESSMLGVVGKSHRQAVSNVYDLYSGVVHALNRTISVKDSTASQSSNTSDDSTSSASSVEGDELSTQTDEVQGGAEGRIKYGWEELEDNLYDLDLTRFQEDEFTQEFYNRYIELGSADQSQLQEPYGNRPRHFSVKIEPLDEYRSDIYTVEEPTVSKRSKDIYSKYVQCGNHGPSEPSKANKELYRLYVKQLFQ